MCQMYRCELAGKKKGKISENITRQLVISLSLIHNMNKLVHRLELTLTRGLYKLEYIEGKAAMH